MLEAALEATAFAEGHGRSNLDQDRKLILALVKAIKIVGMVRSEKRGRFTIRPLGFATYSAVKSKP